ncbi:MAG: hypothetical protein KME06_06820 [Kastovskya adunca ATA6-11-RM4]|nr:hypothetical protein [Kastovskya adunca ATA6-11-RM4]
MTSANAILIDTGEDAMSRYRRRAGIQVMSSRGKSECRCSNVGFFSR